MHKLKIGGVNFLKGTDYAQIEDWWSQVMTLHFFL